MTPSLSFSFLFFSHPGTFLNISFFFSIILAPSPPSFPIFFYFIEGATLARSSAHAPALCLVVVPRHITIEMNISETHKNEMGRRPVPRLFFFRPIQQQKKTPQSDRYRCRPALKKEKRGTIEIKKKKKKTTTKREEYKKKRKEREKYTSSG